MRLRLGIDGSASHWFGFWLGLVGILRILSGGVVSGVNFGGLIDLESHKVSSTCIRLL